jgi:hypothetical protein
MGLASAKLLIEAPVNGGRNYNGPKVEFAALVKSGYMLETPSILQYSFHTEYRKIPGM